MCFFCLYGLAVAQEKLDHLRKWEGRYPTYNKGQGNFFRLPEIERPLRKLLSKEDFYHLIKGHKKESPIEVFADTLKVDVCGAGDCAGCCRNALLRIDLKTGNMQVTFYDAGQVLRQYNKK